MTLRELFDLEEVQKYASKADVFVNDDRVWDYKDLDGELKLIHEQTPGSDKYESVKLIELKEFLDLEVKSESLEEKPVTAYELSREGNQYKFILSI